MIQRLCKPETLCLASECERGDTKSLIYSSSWKKPTATWPRLHYKVTQTLPLLDQPLMDPKKSHHSHQPVQSCIIQCLLNVPGYGTPDHFVRPIYSMELPLLRQLVQAAPYNTELQCGGGTRHRQPQQLPRRWEGAGQGEWELDLVHILEILGL